MLLSTRLFAQGASPQIIVVDWERRTHVVPIAEIGWTRFLLSDALGDDDKVGLSPRVGLFLQAGGKRKTVGDARTGNASDGLEGDTYGAILRVKAGALVEIRPVRGALRRRINARLGATGWYDRYEETLLVEPRERVKLDVKLREGSGAPNFNEGDRLGVCLALSFWFGGTRSGPARSPRRGRTRVSVRPEGAAERENRL